MGLFTRRTPEMVTPESALRGRDRPIVTPGRHRVLGTPMAPPFPEGLEQATFGMGCFWGAERKFWSVEGVYTTAVGYSGGFTPNPTYEEVCSGRTGHAEVVLVVFDPKRVSYGELLRVFLQSHDPTQLMRQGNDVGTQYRSVILAHGERQGSAARAALARYQEALGQSGYGEIATEVADAGPFYYGEEYHQQYLDANPMGYCGLGGTGVSCPVGLGT
jgi:peptide-methionine (S)-S-oxide reductase